VTDLVRVCPVCDTKNSPERTRCACGASLAGVDFSLPRDDPASSPRDDAPSSPRDDAPSSPRDDLASSPPTRADAGPRPGDVPDEGAPPLDAPVRGKDEVVACPHLDCGQPNPPGSARCLYCNRPLASAQPGLDARPLPPALREFRVVEVFPATGSEADVLLVEDTGGERSVVKLYRKGIDPDFRLLDILAASASDTVVRVLAHGVSEGVAYERLEYVAGGTLADFMQEGPLASADVRRIVSEIADALDNIHAHRILHRDLKPDNVLVRSREPLTLALTDFGIASLAAATQHFTSAARTTRYAAPEVLTGVIDDKADWWSLGMIALEAATGRHPFEGLTEQVMGHQLATRSIDVRAVYDDDLRTLCRGLLLRDPRKRFGAEEVKRWLEGDPTLCAPDDTEAGTTVKPYRIGETECTSAEELALALARHWDDARKDLARGTIARWIEQELADYNLLRRLRDLQDDRTLDDDTRVLRVLRAAAPALPPVWRGQPLGRDVVLAQAVKSADGDPDAHRWLDSVWRTNVLAAFPDVSELRELDRAWRAGWQRFLEAWVLGERLHGESSTQASRRPDREGTHVDFDQLVFGHVVQRDAPQAHDVHGALLVLLNDQGQADALRADVTAGRARLVEPAPWLDSLLASIGDDPAGWLAARGFLELARADSAAAEKRQAATDSARETEIGELRDALRIRVKALLDVAPEDEDIDDDAARALDEGFTRLQELCQRLLGLDLSSEAHAPLRTAVEKMEVQGFGVQRALAGLAHDRGVSRIFVEPRRLAIPMFALLIALFTRNAWIILAAIVIPAVVAVYRWYTRFQATDAVLAALRRFRLPARSFLAGEGVKAPRKSAGRA
jgi:serine/threonine protein kinase